MSAGILPRMVALIVEQTSCWVSRGTLGGDEHSRLVILAGVERVAALKARAMASQQKGCRRRGGYHGRGAEWRDLRDGA